jgi:hypothetical protein
MDESYPSLKNVPLLLTIASSFLKVASGDYLKKKSDWQALSCMKARANVSRPGT